MPKAQDVADLIESISPISAGMEGDELGFVYGSRDAEVTGVAVCWSPTLDVIQQAADQGCNMVVSHEPLLYRKAWSGDAEVGNAWFDEAEDDDKPINIGRMAAIDALGGAVYRYHSNWDCAPELGQLDMLIKLLDLPRPAKQGKFLTLHEVAPVTVGALTRKVQERLDTGPIRVTGDLDRTVTKVGLFWGGFGQMFNSPEELIAMGAEVGIAGECLGYTLHYAQEMGLAVIEAGHCASENPGMRAMAEWLDEQIPDTKVVFIDSGKPWQVIEEPDGL